MRLRVASWNVGNRTGAWRDVGALGCDIVLVQETPVSGVPERCVVERHHRDTRRFGTAIWTSAGALRQLPATTSAEEGTHAGAAAVAELTVGDIVVTLISAHFVDDRVTQRAPGTPDDRRSNGYAVTTAHRVLSDLTGYLDDRRRRGGRGHKSNITIFGGDLNINPGWDQRQGNPAHQLVLDRLSAFGLASVLPIRTDDTHATCVRRGRPIPYPQIDYLYVSDNAEVLKASVMTSDDLLRRGDHLPVVAEIEVR